MGQFTKVFNLRTHHYPDMGAMGLGPGHVLVAGCNKCQQGLQGPCRAPCAVNTGPTLPSHQDKRRPVVSARFWCGPICMIWDIVELPNVRFKTMRICSSEWESMVPFDADPAGAVICISGDDFAARILTIFDGHYADKVILYVLNWHLLDDCMDTYKVTGILGCLHITDICSSV